MATMCTNPTIKCKEMVARTAHTVTHIHSKHMGRGLSIQSSEYKKNVKIRLIICTKTMTWIKNLPNADSI